MNRFRVRRDRVAAALLAVVTVMGCVGRGPVSAHSVLNADAEPLRDAFNADSGKVRIIMLVAPT